MTPVYWLSIHWRTFIAKDCTYIIGNFYEWIREKLETSKFCSNVATIQHSSIKFSEYMRSYINAKYLYWLVSNTQNQFQVIDDWVTMKSDVAVLRKIHLILFGHRTIFHSSMQIHQQFRFHLFRKSSLLGRVEYTNLNLRVTYDGGKLYSMDR